MKLRSSILALGMLAGVGGCQVAPGDYVIIRVANAETQLSDSCYDNMVPDSEKDDRTDLRSGGSIAIFAADTETYFLELGDIDPVSIEGTRDGGDYSFGAEDIDVEADYTITQTWDVQLTIANKNVVGTSTYTQQCSGNNCPVVASCVQTTDFLGTVVRGVELEHGV